MKIKKPFKTYKNAEYTANKYLSIYVRMYHSDSNGICTCVSCGTRLHWKLMDAGHFHKKSKGKAIKFYFRNIHPECPSCNRYNPDHLIGYGEYMVKTYGQGIYAELQAVREQTYQYKEYEYIALIQFYKKEIKQLII